MPVINTQSLFNTDTFSDYTIKCGTYEFKTHKIILASGSEWFDHLFRNFDNFGAGQGEGQRSHTMPTSEQDVVSALLGWIYASTYPNEPPGEATPVEKVAFHLKTLRLAELYEVRGLDRKVLGILGRAIAAFTPSEMLTVAAQFFSDCDDASWYAKEDGDAETMVRDALQRALPELLEDGALRQNLSENTRVSSALLDDYAELRADLQDRDVAIYTCGHEVLLGRDLDAQDECPIAGCQGENGEVQTWQMCQKD